jgi:hypothetical protein
MTVRTVLRFTRWRVAPDREPDAEPLTYAIQCAVCGKRSAAGVETGPAQDWVLRHAARTRHHHHSYREIITRPWRACQLDSPE